MKRLAMLGATAALTVPSIADAKPRPVPATVVQGMTVEVRGISGKARSVVVAGRRAKLVAGRRIRFVVPKVKPGFRRADVRLSNGRRVPVRLRVRAPFRGRFTATAQTARKRGAEIGPAGGAVRATGSDRIAYELAIPPGALAAPTRIELTPLRRIRGLPSPGRTAGVRMEPSGLRFARPASLTITLPRALRHASIAFHGRSNGSGATVAGGGRRGRTVTVTVHHFSATVLNEITDPSGWGGVLNALLEAASLDLQDAETVAGVLELWAAEDPGGCAQHQALCDQVKDRAVATVLSAFYETCDRNRTTPRFNDLTELRRLEALRDRIKPGGWASTPQSCVHDLLNGLIAAAATPTRDDALQRSTTAHEQLEPAQLAAADVNTPGPAHPVDVSHSEWMRTLRAVAANEDEPGLAAAALDHLKVGLGRALEDGLELCDTDQAAGYLVLRAAHGVADGVDAALAQELDAASEQCFIGVTIAPAEVTAGPGDAIQFSALVTPAGVDGSVDWAASAGSISGAGLYTAPAAPGDYAVTATSTANPSRRATAVVHVRRFEYTYLDYFLSNGISHGGVEGQGEETQTGDCAFYKPDPITPSYSKHSQCSWVAPYGHASNVSDLVVSNASSVQMHTDSEAAWNVGEAGDMPGARGSGAEQFKVDFTIAESTPFQLSGSLSVTQSGATATNNAYVVLESLHGNGKVFERTLTGNASSGIGASGTLAPDDYTLLVQADSEARTGPGFGAEAGASSDATVSLQLNP